MIKKLPYFPSSFTIKKFFSGHMGPLGRPSFAEKKIHRRIQEISGNTTSCNPNSSVEQIVDGLRAAFADYARKKLPTLTNQVKSVLVKQALDPAAFSTTERKTKRKSTAGDEDKDGESSSPAAKKSRKTRKIHENKKDAKVDGDGGGGDLTKSMLRNKYSALTTGNKQPEKNCGLIRGESKKVAQVPTVANLLNPNLGFLKTMAERSNANANANRLLKNGGYVGGGVGGGGGGGGGFEVKGSNGGPRFKDLGGMDELLKMLERKAMAPLLRPELLLGGLRPISGILLNGPPGCGKTTLARAIANEAGVPLYEVSSAEFVSSFSGVTESNIRDLFSKAYSTAPSVIFIDEFDGIATKRDNYTRPHESRFVAQLMTCMCSRPENPKNSDGKPGNVLVIGATNRPDAIDKALRRPGRFDLEITLGPPDENARLQILSVLTRNVKLESGFDLAKISRSTPGFSGADLEGLVMDAVSLSVDRIIDERESELSNEQKDGEQNGRWWSKEFSKEEIEKHYTTMSDFEVKIKTFQPSSKREGFSDIPNVKWEDIGGLEDLRKEFIRHIIHPIKYPKTHRICGLLSETGFLLHGPPGCGKTLIARAVANEAGANFIHVKGPELLNKNIGESELAVRTIFTRARNCSPCILFFDEIDGLATRRGKEGGFHMDRVVDQLLTELDGGDQRKGVYVIGATNRRDAIDPAILRPGRLGKHLYVPLPNPDERASILKALARKMPVHPGVDLIAIGRSEACTNFSGADLAALMNEAATAALIRTFGDNDSDMAAFEETLRSAPENLSCGMQIAIKDVDIEGVLRKISSSVPDNI